MAETTPPTPPPTPPDVRSEIAGGGSEPDPGAPIAPDQIDPDLVKLSRTRPKIGVITAAGIVFLCSVFLLRLGPDRRFAGKGSEPQPATVADVLAGKVDTDKLVVITAEPLVSHAIRTTTSKGSLGLRIVPVRGSGDRLWIAVSGDGWEAPAVAGYAGRLRKLEDLAFAPATQDHAAEHPRRGFAEWTPDQHRAKQHAMWAKREPRTITCRVCGTEFQSTGMRAAFCSRRCQRTTERKPGAGVQPDGG